MVKCVASYKENGNFDGYVDRIWFDGYYSKCYFNNGVKVGYEEYHALEYHVKRFHI